MLGIHHVNAFLVIAACLAASGAAFLARRRGTGRWVAQAFALAQALVVAQVLFGLLLLAQHRHAAERLHYLYGTLALLSVFAPWLYAPIDRRARLLWFGITSLLAAALAVRAYMTAT